MRFISLFHFSIFVLTIVVQAAPPKTGPVPPLQFDPPKPERRVLSNGIVVFILEDSELPLFSMTLRMKVSPADVPAGLDGAMNMMGTVWRTGGTRTRSPDQLNEELEFFPATIETSAGEEAAVISLSCLSRDINDVLPIFYDVLSNPDFDSAQLALAKSNLLESIRRKNDTPVSIARRAFRDVVYGPTHLYARNPTPPKVKKIKRKHLSRLHQKVVAPDQAVLSVTGDFDTERIMASLESLFQNWAPTGRGVPEYDYGQGQPPEGSLFFVQKDFNQSRIYIGNKGIRRHDEDEFALAVGDTILGGGGGARLWTEIRAKRGLAYVVGSFYTKSKAPGLIGVGCQTKAESTVLTLNAILNELDAFTAAPPTTEEISLAKESIINAFVFNFESKANIVDEQSRLEFFGYEPDYLETYPLKIQAVSGADILDVAETYYNKERRKIVVVGDKTKLDGPLDEVAPVTEIPLEAID